MPVVILDEFTNLPVSRQRKWQMRKKKQERCVICGSPTLATINYCEEHSLVARTRARDRRRRAVGQDIEAPLAKAGRPRKF